MINRHPSGVLDAADVVRIDRSQRGLLRPTISHDVELLVTNFVAVSVLLHVIYETMLTIYHSTNTTTIPISNVRGRPCSFISFTLVLSKKRIDHVTCKRSMMPGAVSGKCTCIPPMPYSLFVPLLFSLHHE